MIDEIKAKEFHRDISEIKGYFSNQMNNAYHAYNLKDYKPAFFYSVFVSMSFFLIQLILMNPLFADYVQNITNTKNVWLYCLFMPFTLSLSFSYLMCFLLLKEKVENKFSAYLKYILFFSYPSILLSGIIIVPLSGIFLFYYKISLAYESISFSWGDLNYLSSILYFSYLIYFSRYCYINYIRKPILKESEDLIIKKESKIKEDKLKAIQNELISSVSDIDDYNGLKYMIMKHQLNSLTDLVPKIENKLISKTGFSSFEKYEEHVIFSRMTKNKITNN